MIKFKQMNLIKILFISLYLTIAVFCFVSCSCAHVKSSSHNVKFISHRGYSSMFYENTKKAFEEAGKSNFFYGIETDIRLTLDNEFVCAHSNSPFRDKSTTLSNTTLAEALTLPLENDNYFIATFEEYLNICEKYNKVAVIEPKIDLNENEITKIYEMLLQRNMVNKCIFISFNKENIILVNDMYPEVKVQILYMFSTQINFNYDLSLSTSIIEEQHISKAHENNKEIGVWAVNKKDEIKKFIGLKVDYITTNYVWSL